jgi:hypothetical protein
MQKRGTKGRRPAKERAKNQEILLKMILLILVLLRVIPSLLREIVQILKWGKTPTMTVAKTMSMMVPPAGGTRAVEAPMPAIMTLTLIATSTQNLIILSLRKIAPANHGVLKNIMVLRLPVMIKLRATLILQC